MKKEKREQPEKREQSGRGFVLIVMALHIAITLWVGWHHEPWRDEADVWLLMRDGGVRTMFVNTGFIGMPSLWYLSVAIPAATGMPYFSMTLIHLVFAWIALLVFLLWAPFPRWVKALYAFSYFVAFEYSVVARPYVLTMLFLFSALAGWRMRRERPLPSAVMVAFLASSTTHGLIMAALLGALFLLEVVRERRWKERDAVIAVAIMLLGGVLALVQLWPPENAPDTHYVRGFNLSGTMWAFGNAFFPGLGLWGPFAGAVVIMGVTAIAMGKRLVPQVFFWAMVVALAVIYTYVWVAGYRHAGLVLLVVLAALWLAALYDADPRWLRRAHVLVALSLAYCCVVAYKYWGFDTKRPFSGGEEMGQFIRANGLDRYEIAAHKMPEAEAVLPYLPGKRFYYPGIHDDGSYLLWDATFNVAIGTPYALAVADAQQRFLGKPWLLLVNTKMDNPEQYGFRLLYTNLSVPFEHPEERYWLYAPLDWRGEPLPEVK
jgi:hypothetical protein